MGEDERKRFLRELAKSCRQVAADNLQRQCNGLGLLPELHQ